MAFAKDFPPANDDDSHRAYRSHHRDPPSRRPARGPRSLNRQHMTDVWQMAETPADCTECGGPISVGFWVPRDEPDIHRHCFRNRRAREASSGS